MSLSYRSYRQRDVIQGAEVVLFRAEVAIVFFHSFKICVDPLAHAVPNQRVARRRRVTDRDILCETPPTESNGGGRGELPVRWKCPSMLAGAGERGERESPQEDGPRTKTREAHIATTHRIMEGLQRK